MGAELAAVRLWNEEGRPAAEDRRDLPHDCFVSSEASLGSISDSSARSQLCLSQAGGLVIGGLG